MTDVEILEHWAGETALRKKWLKTWEQLGVRILKFPKWMQTIISRRCEHRCSESGCYYGDDSWFHAEPT